MARILDYIAEQLDNINSAIDSNTLLKSEDMYIIAKYIARNPDFVYGNCSPFVDDTKKYPIDGLLKATYGVNTTYWKDLKAVSDTKGKQKTEYFKERILTPKGAKDKDVRSLFEKLFRNFNFDDLVDALGNLINYQILNNSFQSESKLIYDKIYTNLNFSSLPYGVINSINTGGIKHYVDNVGAMNIRDIEDLMKSLSPFNLNLSESTLETTSKFFEVVVNSSEGTIMLDYNKNKARGYIRNEKTFVIVDDEYNCSPLSLQSTLDTSYFNGGYSRSKDKIELNATKISVGNVLGKESCSKEDLDKIQKDSEFINTLVNNDKYVKVSGIKGKEVLNNIMPFSAISRNFYDTNSTKVLSSESKNGYNAISIKLFFDKQKEIFINTRSNDLFFALSCATFGDTKEDTIDIYFNESEDNAYFVNSNQEQYGYCEGVQTAALSNCEHILYAELYKPSLSIQQKSQLFEEQDVRPIIISDKIINESDALEDALQRQSKLQDIQEGELFYKLLMDSVISFVYTYAEQVKVKGKLVWKNKKNPKWSLDSNEGKYFKNKDGKHQWSNPDNFYIYDVRETFWMNNQGMSIKEVLAYFVTKGGSSKDNSSYYRKLCQRILGIDYFIFSKKLFPLLLQEGYICVEKLDIAQGSGEVVNRKYTYCYDYASGDVYKKLELLQKELQDNIKLYFGESKGNQIVDNQFSILEKAKPKRLSFGDKEPSRNLIINIHNPIFFSSKESFVGRIGNDYGVFRDGKVKISTVDSQGVMYKEMELGGYSRQKVYKDFRDKNPLNLTNNHLKKFYEWIMFGKGVDFISNPNLKQNEFYLIDGYVFPMPSSKFITKHILPKFEKIADEGENTPCPLEFLPQLGNQQKTFTKGNVYKKENEKYQYSNLTQRSRENLIKIGLVEDKPKKSVDVIITDPKDPSQTITKKQMFTPITEKEGKRIFNVISDKYKKLESEIIIEGNTLFTTFCKTQLQPDYRIYIESKWNETYNNMAIANYEKFPIFCEHSRWFGSMPNPFLFNLRDAQVEGMKFAIANKNSGLLAHEVGFGKTTTSIAMMSHMILTGESSRTIVFTPNQVYEKFSDEIIGRDTTGTLGLLSNWQVLEKNKREGNKSSIDVIKFGNASATILFGTKDVVGLKDYNDLEKYIISRWKGRANIKGKKRNEDDKGVLEQVRSQLKNLPAGRPTFLPEDNRGNIEESRISKPLRESDANEWYDEFTIYLATKIPEIYENDDTNVAVDGIVNKIDLLIQKIYATIDSEFEKYKTGYRYTSVDFSGDNKSKITTYPKSIQEWWKKADPKANKNTINYALGQSSYPQKGWISNPADALKDGVITQIQYNRIIQEEKQYQTPWEGVLSELGLSKIKKLENNEAKVFFNPTDNKYSGRVTVLLRQIEGMLIDILGKYKDKVLEPNKIILCSHQAIKKFRATEDATNKAKMYVQNVEDIRYVNNSTNRFYDNLANLPLSFRRLNIDGICVDEIHNFNNLISKPREQSLSNVAPTRGTKLGKDFHLLPTMNASAALKFLPDGDNINSTEGLYVEEGTPYHNAYEYNKDTESDKKEKEYRLGYYSSGKGSLTTAPANLMALIFQVQNKEENGDLNNTILMSATPFTDNIFQMFSVFGMTNLKKMKESNIMSVWEFFVTFVKEEWRYNITHRQTFGLFPEIQSYYNTSAMANFIKAMANFKVSDKIIEADRPLKYIIPQDGADSGYQAGANTSSVAWASELKNVSSYVELNPIQTQIMKKIAEYVEGKIDVPFQYCPNYGEAIQVEKDSGEISFANDEVKDSIEQVMELLKQAKKEEEFSNEWEELMYEARAILVSLRESYPEDGRIAQKQRSVDKALFDKETLKDMADKETLYDSNYEDIDLSANSKNEVKLARAIVGQGFGQMCVISPYLLKCDKNGDTPNDLLKDYPLYPNDLSKSAKNFVENSPKIKYAIECAINTIKYDSKVGGVNDRQVGGQIIYVNKGKSMKYGGHYYNLYEMIQTYIVDRKIKYYDNINEKESIITKENIGVITGGMSGKVKATDKYGEIKMDSTTDKPKTIGRREDIRDKFNDGRVKILIGSSAIKEGIDLNKRAHTLYVLDSDFSPSNAMQLEGRIWRQKNMWEFVRIVYVLGRDSIDAFVYSKLQSKITEIKKMLESGVYELNKTQYTINAKERIRNIISDVDQLTDLAWQDRVDVLNAKIAKSSDEKSKLMTIKSKYSEVKLSFDKYVYIMNKLYKVVVYNEKRILAEKEKTRLDIKKQYEWQKESRGRGRLWKEENKFIPIKISEAISIIEKEVDDNIIFLKNEDIHLNSNSQMLEVNSVADQVRKMIRARRGTMENLLEFDPIELDIRMQNVTKESSLSEQIINIIISHQKDKKGFKYDGLLRRVNEFITGSEYESIMSNYSYLVTNVEKNESTKETYDIQDIDVLITKASNRVVEGQSELNSEKKWKVERRIKEKEIQYENSKNRGDNLETLIENFNHSMSLLKIRVK